MPWSQKKSMVVSKPVHPGCPPFPAATSCWPVSACPSSPAAEPLSDEAAAQPETTGARPELQPHRGVRLLGGCCVCLAPEFGAWLDRPEDKRGGKGEEREEEGGRRCPPLPLTSPLLLLCPPYLSSVLSGKTDEKNIGQKHTAEVDKYYKF